MFTSGYTAAAFSPFCLSEKAQTTLHTATRSPLALVRTPSIGFRHGSCTSLSASSTLAMEQVHVTVPLACA